MPSVTSLLGQSASLAATGNMPREERPLSSAQPNPGKQPNRNVFVSSMSPALNLVNATARAMPTAVPIAASLNDYASTQRVRSEVLAPSAMRMPISLVRWLTRWDKTP